MSPSPECPTYHAYILRVWQERPESAGQPAVWRFSLQDTREHQRVGFGSLDQLTAFLESQMEAAVHGSEGVEGQG